jgi:hypothetical protein
MILGLDRHPQAACFVELDDAVRALRGRDDIYFNAHTFDAPEGGVIFNLENVPRQVDPARWAGREVWDFSAVNAAKYGATHVPLGYHPSFERFERSDVQDIDVVFAGCVNERRAEILADLADQDLMVVVVPPGIYGAERDAVLARAKLALNMQYYEDGTFPALRVAHLVANRVPFVSEVGPEMPSWAGPGVAYGELVRTVLDRVNAGATGVPEALLDAFRASPMVLP